MTRLISGLVLALLAILGIVYLAPEYLKLIIALLSGIASYECVNMFMKNEKTLIRSAIVVFSVFCSLGIMFQTKLPFTIGLYIAFLVIAFMVFLIFFHSDLSKVKYFMSQGIFVFIYCGLFFAFFGLMRDLLHGHAWLFFTLATTFAADTGAFLAGHACGKHKLAPKISPGKTIEGFGGGIIGSLIVTSFFKLFIFPYFMWQQAVVIALITSVIGPLGDLSESMLKRSTGVKDSSNLIPGHGGLLDRVDALIFATPCVYCYALFF